jgi:hypothetical protein
MKALIERTRRKDMAFLNGKIYRLIIGMMEEYIEAIGRMENNTAMANFTPKKKGFGKRASGAMEKESSGTMPQALLHNSNNNFLTIYRLIFINLAVI